MGCEHTPRQAARFCQRIPKRNEATPSMVHPTSVESHEWRCDLMTLIDEQVLLDMSSPVKPSAVLGTGATLYMVMPIAHVG